MYRFTATLDSAFCGLKMSQIVVSPIRILSAFGLKDLLPLAGASGISAFDPAQAERLIKAPSANIRFNLENLPITMILCLFRQWSIQANGSRQGVYNEGVQ